MKSIYIVRHGESETNARLHTFCVPDEEVQLTEKGEQQSRFIAERAVRLKAEALISSPFVRTRDTARLISERTGLSIELESLFGERRTPTALVGMKFGTEESDAFYRAWTSTFFKQGERVDDGENFDDLKSRARAALEYLEKRPESKIIVVSHGFFLRVLLCYIMFGEALTPEEVRGVAGSMRTDNTGITLLTHDVMPFHDIDHDIARWRIRAYNDHAHLG